MSESLLTLILAEIHRAASSGAAIGQPEGLVADALPGPRVVLAAYDGEEQPHFLAGTMGSMYHVAHPTVPLAGVDMMVCMDLVGHAFGFEGLPDSIRTSLFALGALPSPALGVSPYLGFRWPDVSLSLEARFLTGIDRDPIASGTRTQTSMVMAVPTLCGHHLWLFLCGVLAVGEMRRSLARLTVTVRPGKPNGAASSFFSGIIREPLAGVESVCPVSPEVSHPVASPGRTVDGLIAVYEASREDFKGRLAMNLAGLNVTVGEMLQALEQVAGKAVRERVRFERDERIAGIVANWPTGAGPGRAAALGLQPDSSFADIIRQYIADCEKGPNAAEALKGLAR